MLKIGCGAVVAGAVGSWAWLRHVMLSVGPDRRDWGQEVFGHRGCRFVSGIPENTVPAFEYAALNCASGLECDVQMCKSGELVVFHDPALGKCVQPPSEARVLDKTLEELQSMELAEDTERHGVRLCTVEDVIEVAREHDMKLLIEMKPLVGASAEARRRYVHTVLKLFEEDDFLLERAMVISFNPAFLYQLRRQNPRIAVIQLSKPDLISGATEGGVTKAVPLPLRLLPPRLADRLLHFCLYSIAPWVIGASGVGIPYTSFNDLEVHRWNARRMFLYVWGFPSPETCTAAMRSPGVAVAADDQFGLFFAKPRYPLRKPPHE